MGRTIPSFRIALERMEERKWNKPFRNASDKSDRKKFAEMFGILGFTSPVYFDMMT